VQLRSSIRNVPLSNHRLIAAGSLFAGEFRLNTNYADPRSMTFFGIPFTMRPTAVAFEAQYIPGPQLMQSVKENGVYVIHNIAGTDCGQAWAEMLNWNGSGNPVYHGGDTAPAGLTVLGRGELVFDGANDAFRTWGRYTMPIVYNSSTLPPTHIAVVFSSGKDGDLFKGAPDSIMNIDNVELTYQ
jgi:hypothetical protein